MLIEVGEFCQRVEADRAGLIDELQELTGRYGDNERKAWEQSLPKLSVVLARPRLQSLHLHLGQSAGIAIEYRLPASSSWCDVVLLGRDEQQPCALILELKDWDTNGDRAGPREGLIEHKGTNYLHPSDQVRGYVEYCQRFHSAVQETKASVHGCVLFTRADDVQPYRERPHADLAAQYPLFTNSTIDVDEGLVPFVSDRLKYPDKDFALQFENGTYKQDRNFVMQVSNAIRAPAQKHFVLLDEQRRGFEECLRAIDRLVASRDPAEKLAVIIEGPPGSGKSVIAAHLWATLVADNKIDGPVVLTTTSGCQKSNWSEMFARATVNAARGVVMPANRYNPGLTSKWVKDRKSTGHSVSVSNWKNHVSDFLASNRNRVPDNSFAVSIVDEAHALIDPTVPGCVRFSGWCFQAGPQVWHILRASRVSVFLMDSEQSYRDNETTTPASIERYAKMLGVDRVEVISLAGAQFRCGGSKEYIDWMEGVLSLNESAAHSTRTWRRTASSPSGKFQFELVDDPQAVEDALRHHLQEGKSARLVASYARRWLTQKESRPHEVEPHKMDFHLPYSRNGATKHWSRIWNYAPDQEYSHFIQRPEGTRMHDDPLCEVGCPYVMRGFDYDYLGVLWLSDLVWRKGEWRHQFDHIHETAWLSTKAAAKPNRRGQLDSNAVAKLLHRLKRGYRILLSRAIHGVYVWVEDAETREHVNDFLKT